MPFSRALSDKTLRTGKWVPYHLETAAESSEIPLTSYTLVSKMLVMVQQLWRPSERSRGSVSEQAQDVTWAWARAGNGWEGPPYQTMSSLFVTEQVKAPAIY